MTSSSRNSDTPAIISATCLISCAQATNTLMKRPSTSLWLVSRPKCFCRLLRQGRASVSSRRRYQEYGHQVEERTLGTKSSGHCCEGIGSVLTVSRLLLSVSAFDGYYHRRMAGAGNWPGSTIISGNVVKCGLAVGQV